MIAAYHSPADEIDAIGTKRYEATSGGEREIQRTMLELLNQLDGFDSMGDVKVGLCVPAAVQHITQLLQTTLITLQLHCSRLPGVSPASH